MGEVYRARDLRLGREVAIKVLPEELSGDAEALARFDREARAIAALSHPNLLAIYDFGADRGVSFAVTELLRHPEDMARKVVNTLPFLGQRKRWKGMQKTFEQCATFMSPLSASR